MGQPDHRLQFYDAPDYLWEVASGFCARGVGSGQTTLVIATGPTRAGLEQGLRGRGVDLSSLRQRRQYVPVDAADTLLQFTVDGQPDETRFVDVVGTLLQEASHRPQPSHVRVFAEMVVLLQLEGNWKGAIRLEQLWNSLARLYSYTLLCAYPMDGFRQVGSTGPMLDICAEHSQVFPTERYSRLERPDARLREISALQQRAKVLEVELEQRRQLEASLKERERELSDFFENAAEGLDKLAPDGTVRWANKAQLELLGYTEAEYVGHPLCEFHVQPESFERWWSQLRSGQRVQHHPVDLRCKDGTLKHVLISANAHWDGPRFVFARCLLQDVSDRLESELRRVRLEQLAETDRQKDEFLAMLAHELRNPLAPIQLAVRLLRAPTSVQNAGKYLDLIDRQAEVLTRLVNDLLDVSRLLYGKVVLHKERLGVDKAVAWALDTTRNLMQQRQHRVSVTLPPLPVYVLADPIRLEQILVNLLVNAAKYTPPGGQVSVSVEADASSVQLAVRDTGIGIAAELLEHIFHHFRQAERGLDRAEGGLGLGLTIVRRLVELHEGRIEARSGGKGQGAEFVVRLPRVAAERAWFEAAPEAAVWATQDRLRILVVDDNEDAAMVLGDVLAEQMGHEVRIANDGACALEILGQFHPQLVLLDIGLPGMDGYEVAQRIRAAGSDAILVAVTGYTQPRDHQRSREAGFSAHLGKPLRIETLANLLQAVRAGAPVLVPNAP